MNTNTNHLIDPTQHSEEELKKLEEAFGEFTPIPDPLQYAAKLKLAGRKETYVSQNSGGKLSKWAANQRRIQHRK